jgi:ABC-2 type transport system ATP-binding protein
MTDNDRHAPPVVDVRGLRKDYRGRPAVDGIDLDVRPGEIFGIAGPNGAGKTTLVECLTGLRTPDAGTVRVLGLDPGRDRRRLLQQVGVQLQQSVLPGPLKVQEALRLYASCYAEPADWRELMDRWELTDKRGVSFADLSGGWRQRLLIALALVGRPRVAVLDELTTALDPYARRATWELVRGVRAEGVTVLLVSHFMDEAEYLCDRVMIMDRGRVRALGTPAELTARGGHRSLDEAFVDLIGATA